jgi:polyphosphate kinase 2 (PPK2 family)
MLEALDLSLETPKADYKRELPALQRRLHRLQRACWETNLATMIVFEGWDAAGKGTTIRKLTQKLEPRNFSLHAIREPRTFETHLPWLWRYWIRVPNWGEMAIFDRSWYGRVLVQRVEGLITEEQWRRGYRDIVFFERTLADDRYLIIKFFLHIAKTEQKRRFEQLSADPMTAWQVEPEDWKHHEEYDDYLLAVEEVLERTETEFGPWTLVEATDKYWTRLKVFKTLIEGMEKHLRSHDYEVPVPYVDPDDDDVEEDEGDPED